MITFMQAFLNELEHESVGTRKMLSLFPDDKPDWKPHEKSMKIKDLAIHIADLPTWITLCLTSDHLDFEKNPYNPEDCKSAAELLNYFDKNVAEAKACLSKSNDDILEDTWTLRSGDVIYMQTSRLEALRHDYCQIVHHRAQLGVYLRLLNIPIPGVYGPSADEMGM